MAENQIEVEKDFVVTYNCHTDEYTIKDSTGSPKVVKGWQVYAHGYTAVAREEISKNKRSISKNKRTNKVKWGLRKSTNDEDYDDYYKERRSPQTIRWAVKISGGKSSEVFVFVNSVSFYPAQVKWNVVIPKKDLTMQLSPCIINKIQLEQGFGDFSGMGILSPDFIKRLTIVKT